MKRTFSIFKTHRHALVWTACYACVMWIILKTMFNFDMFSAYQWHRLMNAQLHGFAGFVFGILILAAPPLYVATITLIIRKKQPLVTIPKPKIPQCFKHTAPEPEKKEEQEENKPTPAPERNDIPLELRSAFSRARHRIAAMPTQTINNPVQSETATAAPANNAEALPLPTDFDIDLDFAEDLNTPEPAFSSPIFTEVNFDPTPAAEPTMDENILADMLNETDSENHPDTSKITEYLKQNGQTFEIDGDIVITPEFAIATHSDKDFWVADNENWFAAGKICPSPIHAAQQAAQKHGRKPVVCLISTNIMELDNNIKTWESAGIKIITDPSEL